MEIYYISSLMSNAKINFIFDNSTSKPLQSIQKFHRLLCEGLVKNDTTVKTISCIPMSRKIMKKVVWFDKNEVEDNIVYKYIPFINLKIIRQLCVFIFGLWKLFVNLLGNRRKKIVICDVLNTTLLCITVPFCKFFKIKCIAVVTDLPIDINVGSISSKINQFFQSKFDGYIFITEHMNGIVNEKNKPYIVIEGFSDIKNVDDSSIQKKNICMYAGGLYEKYGIKLLIDAFNKIQNDNIELHLYGHGDMIRYITDNKFKNVKYMGILKNDEVVEKEKESILLINPRFSNFDYTKYSFPSKIVEYMSTGTPVLTTKLPGIPDEYYKFLYVFDDETLEGFIKTIDDILNKKKSELTLKGFDAKKFVIEFKNNIVQTKKLKIFLEKILDMEVEK